MGATHEELRDKSALVLQAQCFYFSRKFNVPAIDTSAYSSWVQSQSQQPASQPPPQTGEPLSAVFPSTTELSSTTSSAAPAEPPYPTSFAHIVDLITRNIPVPGIEEIPDTVLEPGTSKIDKTPRRRKPWEKDSDTDPGPATPLALDPSAEGQTHEDTHADAGTKTDNIDLNGHKETGQGVVNILKPNAVPDSGLLAKDWNTVPTKPNILTVPTKVRYLTPSDCERGLRSNPLLDNGPQAKLSTNITKAYTAPHYTFWEM